VEPITHYGVRWEPAAYGTPVRHDTATRVAEEKYIVGLHASEPLGRAWYRVSPQRSKMRIPGERIKRTRLIQTEKYVVAMEVEMVVPVDDQSEPCYESETIQLLREVKEHAE
jgi:hypothetical protein